jgi:two-component system sensor histidine kinase YesM
MKTGWEIFNKVNDIPLKYKFILIYVLCVLIPLITINLVSLSKITTSVKEKEAENFRISMERAQTDIVGLIKGCIAVSNSVVTDRALDEILERKYQDINEYYKVYYSYLRDSLNRVVPIYTHISEICIYTNNPTIASGGNYVFIDDAVKSKQWYQTIDKSTANIILDYYREPKSYLRAGHAQNLCVLRKMNEFGLPASRSKLLKINLDINQLFEIFNREQDYLSICLVDPGNRMIYAPNNQLLGEFSRIHKFYQPAAFGKDWLVFERKLGSAIYLNHWRIVGIGDKRKVLNALSQSRNSIFNLALISTLISTLLILIIIRSYNYRVRQLAVQMEKVKNQQFELMEIHEGKDEIGGLIQSFNLMAAKINSLINDVYKLEIQKKDLELERVRAELNFLQSQMNPHFLFNTLNALLVVCVKNNYTEIIEVLKNLSKTLRRLFSWQDDLVTIEEEITFSEMYLKIEKFRFGDKFQYEINCNKMSFQCKIPKMTIQPLIENACKHGIQSIKGVGLVKADIDIVEGLLTVWVRDNGCGMDAEKLDEIMLHMTADNESGGHIGLRNVYRRLKLYYGETVHLNISSGINAGTEVSFTVPVNKLQPADTLKPRFGES